jgi:hypothetical protein
LALPKQRPLFLSFFLCFPGLFISPAPLRG